MSERNSQMPAPEHRSTAEWSTRLAETLAFNSGNSPTLKAVSGDKNEIREAMLWWRSSDSQAILIGVSEADTELLLQLRREAGGDTSLSAAANLAELLEQSWGRGALTRHRPAATEISEVYEAHFPAGGRVRFRIACDSNTSQGAGNLAMLLDIELPLTLRFGSTHMALKEVADLNEGSIIEFDQSVDDLVEVMVNGHVVARGEAVMVQGVYGVRISEISSKRERLLTSSFVVPQELQMNAGDIVG